MGQHMDYVQDVTTITAADITATYKDLEIGFVPSKVEFQVSTASLKGYWEKTMRDGCMVIEQVNELPENDILLGRLLPLIGSSDDKKVKNWRAAAQFNAAGDVRIEVAAAETDFTATDHDIDAGEWAAYLMDVVNDGTTFVLKRSGGAWGSVGGYATEALAIAAMATKTSSSAEIGYVTVKATAGAIFNATTDALAGGSSGTPADETNYYEGYGIMAGGITPYGGSSGDTFRGVRIGSHGLLLVEGGIIEYKAFR